MKYEANTSHMNRVIRAERVKGMTFGRHMHYSFEFVCVVDGMLHCTIDDKHYTLSAGQGVLVLPDQVHSYRTDHFSEIIMLIFDPIYVSEFHQFMKGKVFAHPVFNPTLSSLLTLPQSQDLFAWKGLLYDLCAQANRYCQPMQDTQKNSHLIEQVLEYVHTCREPSLKELASQLGYNYHYLSNCIRENFGMNFCTLANHYRTDLAATLLRTTDLTMTQVAEQSGFATIRSFNRAFKQLQGVTPSQFVRQNQTP